MALAVFDPTKTSERSADVRSVADVAKEASEQKEQGHADNDDSKPHRLHANRDDKKQQRRDRHSRVESGEGGDEPTDGPGGPDQRRTGINHQLQNASGNAAEEVEKHKTPNSQNALKDVSCEPKAHHVHSQVENPRMEKLVGDELPKHPLPQAGTAETEELVGNRLLALRQDFNEDESENIQANEDLHRRELYVSVAVEHGGKLIAGRTNVDKAGTRAADQDFPRWNWNRPPFAPWELAAGFKRCSV